MSFKSENDSFYFSSNDYKQPIQPPPKLQVVAIQNIAFDLTQSEMRDFCKPFYCVNVHFLMDLQDTLGKTLTEVYVEFGTLQEAHLFILSKDRKMLKNRLVTIRMSSQPELQRRLFPNQKDEEFLTKEERQAILTVCKCYKLHYARKTADRPFELLISIVQKLPWTQVSLFHRDQLFEMYKLASDILYHHLQKTYLHISTGMLNKFMTAALKCRGFTEKQKLGILSSLKVKTSPDLEMYMHLECLVKSNYHPSSEFSGSSVLSGSRSRNSSPSLLEKYQSLQLENVALKEELIRLQKSK